MSRFSLLVLSFITFSSLLCYIAASSQDVSGMSEERLEAMVDRVYDELVRQQDSQEDDEANCGCSWASPYTCGTNDGTVCNIQCCSKYRGGGGNNGGNNHNSGSSSSGWRTGKTTRYFDCAKPSCSWPSNTRLPTFVRSCLKNGVSPASPNGPNGSRHGGGDGTAYAYTCNNQHPFTKNGVMYAFAAANVPCCQCYELEFLSHSVGGASAYRGQLAGKKMIIQVTNKGGDLSGDHFDLMIPGGGLGIFDACSHQFGGHNWGNRYGGVTSESQCAGLPSQHRAGCYWRFRDFKNADNPGVKFRKLSKCPSELTSRSGCQA
uniref:Cellulase n=1 Tax=Percolomonas cosmopolitus TaxID=63605 RepID=A0A7S1PJ52_9EUKA|mmetsp:Transcript_5688/g.21460  ORF Transcript_5688/g.21460 Transcript_5688/m.21460 type:complete len:319 (+) Transcript_5688:23-979(+)